MQGRMPLDLTLCTVLRHTARDQPLYHDSQRVRPLLQPPPCLPHPLARSAHHKIAATSKSAHFTLLPTQLMYGQNICVKEPFNFKTVPGALQSSVASRLGRLQASKQAGRLAMQPPAWCHQAGVHREKRQSRPPACIRRPQAGLRMRYKGRQA